MWKSYGQGAAALAAVLLLTALVSAACGGGSDSDQSLEQQYEAADEEVAREAQVEVQAMEMSDQPAAMEVVVEREVQVEVAAEVEAASSLPFTDDQASPVAQQRIIVRTAEVSLIVNDIPQAVDDVVRLAERTGGWVVSSDRKATHSGSVSVRVPADSLAEVLEDLRGLAVEVRSEVTTSQDVTDQYVDARARLANLQAAQNALVRLMERAERVEDALRVQNELTRVQGDVEAFQGRIKFLEQTSAFSLINVRLGLAPAGMSVDAGPDRTVSLGKVARFRATFRPPDGIDEFTFTWDFGDGAQKTETRTAPTLDEGARVTATVTRMYEDDRDSPFIAEVTITGSGDSGVAEGSDTVIVTVTRIPSIEVFAGDHRAVEEGQNVELVGSFTRPEGLTDLTYRWDFGDGSPPSMGLLEEGVTRAAATHAYTDHRPNSYVATLTVAGQSAAGLVEGTGSLSVFVAESEGWTLAGWSASDTWKMATRALSGVGVVVATALIFALIFSPVWLIAGGALLFWRRRRPRRSDDGRPEVGERSETSAG